ncbi:MAG: hypothetical protein NZ654_03865 [Acidimicrobiales bacterium]|nr:hypothetical protein [Acidimicrobiales bacterium]
MIDGDPPVSRRAQPSHLILVAVVAGLIGMWFYAFLLAPSGNPDRMEDRTWPTSAERRCAEARDAIDALPPAYQSGSPFERSDYLEKGTEILKNMVSDLGSLPGGSASDRDLAARWLEDWESYLSDRQAHVKRLRSEGDVRPLLSALSDGSSMLERMNGFARVNDMESCLDPGDF